MPNLRNGNKEGFEPDPLGCESGILPLSYRAPQIVDVHKRQLSEHSVHTWTVCPRLMDAETFLIVPVV